MSQLTQHITSKYVTAANALKSQSSRRKIIAYVESYDDVLFWRTVLGQFENDRRYFEILLPTRSSKHRQVIGRGKKSAISCLLHNTGRDMIACVDADYDFLMQGQTDSSRLLLDTPYVFHTYAYSIENLQCYAAGLHNVCVMVTLNDHRIFDFQTFMADFSVSVWPLLCWSVALYRKNRYDAMSITDMDHVISLGKIGIDNAQQVISRLQTRVAQRVSMLRHANPDVALSIYSVERDLRRLGLTPETTYLFIHGHHLFEKIVLPLVSSVCSRLVKEREREIHQQSVHRTQMNNELSCYSNSIEDITSMLKKSNSYKQSDAFRQITAQIEAVMKDNGVTSQSQTV